MSVAAVVLVATAVAFVLLQPDQGCATLLAHVDAVARGEASRRVSDKMVYEHHQAAAPRLHLENGDFRNTQTLEQVRECLGADWAEVHNPSRNFGQASSQAWVFTRQDSPLVIHVESRTPQMRDATNQVIVERASP